MKHVYIFCMQSSGVVYGIGTYIQQLTEAIRNKNDVSINIVIRQSEKPEFTVKESDGVRTFYLPHIKNQNNPRFETLYNRNVWYLLRPYIQLGLSDQLIFHLNYYEESSFIPYFKKVFPDCKVLFAIHYQRWCFLINGNIVYFKQIVHNESNNRSDTEKWLLTSYETEKKVLQTVDKIICLSEFTKRVVIDNYHISHEKIAIIYNGLKDEGKILSPKAKSDLLKKMSFSDSELLILFVGRLDRIKGLDILIQAFKIVLNACPQSRLIIIGDGDYNLYLKECKDCWEKITFTGHLDRKTVYQFYQIADVGVIPSFHEQCSYVAIEMMMFGLPLVVSTSTGLSEMAPDYLEPYKTQVLELEKGATIKPTELASKIMTVPKDFQVKKMIRNCFLEKFSHTTMGNRYLTLLDS